MHNLRRFLLMTSIGSTLTLLGCKSDHPPLPPTDIQILSPINIPLDKCKGTPIPTKAILISIDQPTDMFSLNRNIIGMSANSDGTDVLPGSTTSTVDYPPSDSYPPDFDPTPFDVWLKLYADPNLKRDSMLLKFVLADNRMKFRSDQYAIAADAKGKSSLCGLKVSPDGKSAIVWAKYYSNPHQPGKKTVFGYNIGVYLTQPDGKKLPIFIDPAMGNEG